MHSVRMYVIMMLQWLERNIRRPMEGSSIDRHVFRPAKEAYVAIRKLH